MEKISLKLFEFYNLDAELNGLTNQQTGEKIASGLIQEKLSLVTKYWLTELGKKVAAEKATIEELKNDLIKKFGKEDEKGGISIPMVIDELDEEGQPIKDLDKDGNWFTKKTINPAYQEFEKEFNTLLQTEKELEYKAFSLEDFEKVETSENYGTFFKLIKIEETKVVPLN
jgi:molybdopterin converting factor small subunit